eukprot:8207753-Alexandrium_andersonii.AAC.1
MRRQSLADKARLVLSPTDPDAERLSAGVGVLAHARVNPVALNSDSASFKKAWGSGRAACVLLDLGLGVPVRVCVLYGVTNSEHSKHARTRTCELIIATMEAAREHK